MTRPLGLLVLVALLAWPVRRLLVSARWPAITPRTALGLWLSIATASCVGLVGALVEFVLSGTAPVTPRRAVSDFTHPLPVRSGRGDEVIVILLGAVVVAGALGAMSVVAKRSVCLTRIRRRHRARLDLVGSRSGLAPGAVVIDHPDPAAYSVPGHRPRLVVTSGAVATLNPRELRAVLAHERAHLRGHHDLVVLPFSLLSDLIPRSGSLARVVAEVRTLVELAADDRAIALCGADSLAGALRQLSPGGPDAADGVAGFTTQRIERALAPHPRRRLVAAGWAVVAVGVVALPFLAVFASPGAR